MGLILQGEGRRPTSPCKTRLPMDEKILALYGLWSDVLSAIGHSEDPPHQMSDAEVITTGFMAL
jgi:hypothetical protein